MRCLASKQLKVTTWSTNSLATSITAKNNTRTQCGARCEFAFFPVVRKGCQRAIGVTCFGSLSCVTETHQGRVRRCQCPARDRRDATARAPSAQAAPVQGYTHELRGWHKRAQGEHERAQSGAIAPFPAPPKAASKAMQPLAFVSS